MLASKLYDFRFMGCAHVRNFIIIQIEKRRKEKMKVNVTVRPYEGKTKTKAFIELKIDDHLIIKGLTLVEGKKGLFLSFPATKGKDGKFYNSIYSLDKEWIKLLTETVISKYNELKKSEGNTNAGGFN